jgi:hypothetical protein
MLLMRTSDLRPMRAPLNTVQPVARNTSSSTYSRSGGSLLAASAIYGGLIVRAALKDIQGVFADSDQFLASGRTTSGECDLRLPMTQAIDARHRARPVQWCNRDSLRRIFSGGTSCHQRSTDQESRFTSGGRCAQHGFDEEVSVCVTR